MEQTVDRSKTARFKNFVRECRRVLKVTKKPDRIEFSTIVKVSALGIAVIGFMGFCFQMFKFLVF